MCKQKIINTKQNTLEFHNTEWMYTHLKENEVGEDLWLYKEKYHVYLYTIYFILHTFG